MKYNLYHGTTKAYADLLLSQGWKPNQISSGSNQGQSQYLYLTNIEENALWFSQEKGENVVLLVSDIPEEFLKVDPEDGMSENITDELSSKKKFPGYVVLTKELGPEHFKRIS